MRKVLYILGQLEDEDVAWLGRVGRRRDLLARDSLVEQNKAVREIFIVLQGALTVTIHGKAVAELGPGEIVGEMSLIDRRPASATVSASQAACVLAIDKADIESKLAQDHKFAARFYKAMALFLSSRLRATAVQFGDHTIKEDSLDDEEEIDLDVLDNLHLAGLRFDQIMANLTKER